MVWPSLVYDTQQSPMLLKKSRKILYVSPLLRETGPSAAKKKKKKHLAGSPLISGSPNPVLSYHPTQRNFRKKKGLAIGKD